MYTIQERELSTLPILQNVLNYCVGGDKYLICNYIIATIIFWQAHASFIEIEGKRLSILYIYSSYNFYIRMIIRKWHISHSYV